MPTRTKDPLKGLPRHVGRLYKAVDNYIAKEHGSIAVIGGIQIAQFPGDSEFCYKVVVSCVGKKPNYAEKKGLS